jgi:phosphatidylserine synthase
LHGRTHEGALDAEDSENDEHRDWREGIGQSQPEQRRGAQGADVRWLAGALVIFAGITMVSNVRFYSFKDFNLRRSVPFVFIVAIALIIALLSYEPSLALFGLFVVYALSGYVLALRRLLRRKATSSAD